MRRRSAAPREVALQGQQEHIVKSFDDQLKNVAHQIARMGGMAESQFSSAVDALEFIIAGATAVQVGTANFVDPFIWSKLTAGIDDYMQRHGVRRIADLVGSVDTSTREKEWVSS